MALAAWCARTHTRCKPRVRLVRSGAVAHGALTSQCLGYIRGDPARHRAAPVLRGTVLAPTLHPQPHHIQGPNAETNTSHIFPRPHKNPRGMFAGPTASPHATPNVVNAVCSGYYPHTAELRAPAGAPRSPDQTAGLLGEQGLG
uniref:Uncharacterized protein n=1 Tax=Eutreptiella gymnastica TaxID=73025 RepID=A0A7S4LG07_9EUGL